MEVIILIAAVVVVLYFLIGNSTKKYIIREIENAYITSLSESVNVYFMYKDYRKFMKKHARLILTDNENKLGFEYELSNGQVVYVAIEDMSWINQTLNLTDHLVTMTVSE